MAIFIVISMLLFSCTNKPESQPSGNTLFSLIDPTDSGIQFENKLEFDPKFNIYTYRNFYNGGGVAIGDVNNDGFPDIYFTGNQVSSKLYLNKGNRTSAPSVVAPLQFEDVTQAAGVATGVMRLTSNGKLSPGKADSAR